MIFKSKGTFHASLLTILIVSGVLICALGALLLLLPHKSMSIAQTATSTPTLILDPNLLHAHAAIVYDPTNGAVIFAKNINEALPLASLTKLATAQTVLAEISSNRSITINKSDLLQQDEADLSFQEGDTLSLTHLLQVALIGSSNDAMAAVAESVGTDTVEKMNVTASQLGLTHSVFYNPTGLDINTTTSGAYGSAKDVAVLASAFYQEHPDYFELTERPSISVPKNGGIITVSATDAPLLSIPNLIGAKTGYTTLAGGNIVAIFDEEIGHPLVAVVLGSTEKGRFEDIRTLITATQEQL